MRVHLSKVLLFTLAAFVAAGGSMAQPRPPATQPTPHKVEWRRLPDSYDMHRAFPAMARRLGLDGYVILQCEMMTEGTLTDCAVESETPRDLGFGAGALLLAPRFKAKSLSAIPPPGCCGVRIPLHFTNSDEHRPLEPPDARSGEALERAFQVVDQIGYVQQIMKWPEEDWPDNHLTPPASRDAALQALHAAQAREAPRARETLAKAVAAAFDDEELARLVAAKPAEARRRLRSRIELIEGAIRLVNRRVAADARLDYCRDQDCTRPPRSNNGSR